MIYVLLYYTDGGALEGVQHCYELRYLRLDPGIVPRNSLWTNCSPKHFALVGMMYTRLY
jgi:hypothetical protein